MTLRVEHKVATDTLRSPLAERQTQAHTLGEQIDLGELGEDHLTVGLGDANACIADGNSHRLIVGLATTDGDDTLMGELIRIVKQFLQNQPHALLVGTDSEVVWQRSLEMELDCIRTGKVEVADCLPAEFVAAEGLLG